MRLAVVVAVTAVTAFAGASSSTAEPRRGLDPTNEAQTFTYTGASTPFTVPEGIHLLSVTAIGAEGGDAGSTQGGRAAQVIAPLEVQPGDVYQVRVGGVGANAAGGGPRTAAFNGGGAPGAVTFNSGTQIARTAAGGGGATDLRTAGGTLADRVLVAGGGGGAGASGNPAGSGAGGVGGNAGQGGASGGSPLASERGGGGLAGTGVEGGTGGAGANPSGIDGEAGDTGTLGQGGTGGDGDNSPPGPGGGGGGGVYGGGGGGSGGIDTGGGDTLSGGGGGGGGGFSLVPAAGVISIAPQGTAPSLTLAWTRPGTAITKAPKSKIETRKRAVTVELEFSSTSGGASFECWRDQKNPEQCASPASFKLRRGKHELFVRSTDISGNTDVTPAKAKVRVLKKS